MTEKKSTTVILESTLTGWNVWFQDDKDAPRLIVANFAKGPVGTRAAYATTIHMLNAYQANMVLDADGARFGEVLLASREESIGHSVFWNVAEDFLSESLETAQALAKTSTDTMN